MSNLDLVVGLANEEVHAHLDDRCSVLRDERRHIAVQDRLLEKYLWVKGGGGEGVDGYGVMRGFGGSAARVGGGEAVVVVVLLGVEGWWRPVDGGKCQRVMGLGMSARVVLYFSLILQTSKKRKISALSSRWIWWLAL